jgi:cellulose biosynthesis protein BcsQ
VSSNRKPGLNLAQGLAARGYHTLAVDNDAQGNLTSGLLDDPTAPGANVLSFYDDARQAVHPQRIQKHLELIGADIRLAKIATFHRITWWNVSSLIESLRR